MIAPVHHARRVSRTAPGSALPLVTLAWAAAVAAAAAVVLGLGISPAGAQSVTSLTRSNFADRRWTPVSPVDGALAGAGLATDPWSSAYANPALVLAEGPDARASGMVVNPRRDDLRAQYRDTFAEEDGHVAVGEVALRYRVRGIALQAYFAQPSYEHQVTRFFDFDEDSAAVIPGYSPAIRENVFTSATRYAGLGGALRLGPGIVVGVAVEAVFLEEQYQAIPDSAFAPLVESRMLDRSGTAIGGSVGVLVPVGDVIHVGAAVHAAGGVNYDGEGEDEAPLLVLGGVRYGRASGSQLYAGGRWLGDREADLAEPGFGGRASPSRVEVSGGYAYLDAAGRWAFRLGGSLSPKPDDERLKLTRFGVGLSGGTEFLRLSAAYTREQESRESGGNSSRNVILAGVEVGF